MTAQPDPAQSSSRYDEHDAFLCACKGEPYTLEEWEAEVTRLETELVEAKRSRASAREHGVCLPSRFGGAP